MSGTDSEPCVKGNTLAVLIEETQGLLASGALRPAQLRSLPQQVRDLVEHGVLSNEWYPVNYYSRLGDFLCANVERGRKEYLRELGFKDFERLRRARTYRQLDYLGQLDTGRDLGTKIQDSRLIISLMNSIFNFSRWAPARDPKSPSHLVIQVTEAEHIPEVFRFLTEGFQTAMNRVIKPTARAVISERPEPSVIIFRSTGRKPDAPGEER